MLAPRAGIIAFAGSIPESGRSVTIRTADGYSVTLVHLGSLGVRRSASVDEGDPIGTLGRSGDAEWAQPYLHLGVRLTSDPNGYVDPLRFLPPQLSRRLSGAGTRAGPVGSRGFRTGSPAVAAARSRIGARPHRGDGSAASLAGAGIGSGACARGTVLGGDAGARASKRGVWLAHGRRPARNHDRRSQAHASFPRAEVRGPSRRPARGNAPATAGDRRSGTGSSRCGSLAGTPGSQAHARVAAGHGGVADDTGVAAHRGIAVLRGDAAPGRRTPIAAASSPGSVPHGGAAAGLGPAAAASAAARAAAAARRSRLRAGVGRSRAPPAARLGPGPGRATSRTYHFW